MGAIIAALLAMGMFDTPRTEDQTEKKERGRDTNSGGDKQEKTRPGNLPADPGRLWKYRR